MTTPQISVSKRRRLLVRLFYRYLLMNASPESRVQDLLDETQGLFDKETMNHAQNISEKMPILIGHIKAHLSASWPWSRLPFLIQAILLVGVYEINETTTPKAVTINELTQITKDYGLLQHYRFVNAFLDNLPKL